MFSRLFARGDVAIALELRDDVRHLAGHQLSQVLHEGLRGKGILFHLCGQRLALPPDIDLAPDQSRGIVKRGGFGAVQTLQPDHFADGLDVVPEPGIERCLDLFGRQRHQGVSARGGPARPFGRHVIAVDRFRPVSHAVTGRQAQRFSRALETDLVRPARHTLRQVPVPNDDGIDRVVDDGTHHDPRKTEIVPGRDTELDRFAGSPARVHTGTGERDARRVILFQHNGVQGRVFDGVSLGVFQYEPVRAALPEFELREPRGRVVPAPCRHLHRTVECHPEPGKGLVGRKAQPRNRAGQAAEMTVKIVRDMRADAGIRGGLVFDAHCFHARTGVHGDTNLPAPRIAGMDPERHVVLHGGKIVREDAARRRRHPLTERASRDLPLDVRRSRDASARLGFHRQHGPFENMQILTGRHRHSRPGERRDVGRRQQHAGHARPCARSRDEPVDDDKPHGRGKDHRVPPGGRAHDGTGRFQFVGDGNALVHNGPDDLRNIGAGFATELERVDEAVPAARNGLLDQGGEEIVAVFCQHVPPGGPPGGGKQTGPEDERQRDPPRDPELPGVVTGSRDRQGRHGHGEGEHPGFQRPARVPGTANRAQVFNQLEVCRCHSPFFLIQTLSRASATEKIQKDKGKD